MGERHDDDTVCCLGSQKASWKWEFIRALTDCQLSKPCLCPKTPTGECLCWFWNRKMAWVVGRKGENMEFFALITCFYFYVSFPLNALLVVEPDCTWNGTAKLNRPQLSLFCFFCICHYLLFCLSYFPVLLLFLVIPHIEQVSNV